MEAKQKPTDWPSSKHKRLKMEKTRRLWEDAIQHYSRARIYDRRSKGLRVSRKLIKKAEIMYHEQCKESDECEVFIASIEWLHRFMNRYGLSLRQKNYNFSARPSEPDWQNHVLRYSYSKNLEATWLKGWKHYSKEWNSGMGWHGVSHNCEC